MTKRKTYTGTVELDPEQRKTLIAELAGHIGNYEKLAELIDRKEEGGLFRRLGRLNAINTIRGYIEKGEIPTGVARDIYDLLGENGEVEFLRFNTEHNIPLDRLNNGYEKVLEGYVRQIREKYSNADNKEKLEMLGKLEAIIQEGKPKD